MAAYYRVYDYRNSPAGLTVKKLGSALYPSLVIEYGTTLLYLLLIASRLAVETLMFVLIEFDKLFQKSPVELLCTSVRSEAEADIFNEGLFGLLPALVVSAV